MNLLSLILAAATAWSATPRVPLAPGPVIATPLPADAPPVAGHRLVVKLHDDVRARATPTGGLVSRAGADLDRVARLAASQGATFRPLIALPESTIDGFLDRARLRSGREQPDLAGLFVVELPAADTGVLEATGELLQALPEVEVAWIESLAPPPPADISPFTPDLSPMQDYRAPNPGLDFAATLAAGARGASVRVSDVEYGWNGAHEDLVDGTLVFEPGQTIPSWVYSNGWDEHGTAVAGAIMSVENGYGTTGMVPDASLFVYPEYSDEQGSRRATAITNAAAASDYGDVIVLEMQATGPDGNYAPAEVDNAVWLATRAAADAGIIVVAAAGNGDANLDGVSYAEYRGRGHSGAIMVGAGTADTRHDKLWFSSYGARVDVQAWGEWVFTTGYGDHAAYGGDKNQRYTATFGGTSSATSIMGPAVTSVQDAFAQRFGGGRLGPEAMRDMLVSTGIPQGSGGHIGPMPDLGTLVTQLDDVAPVWQDLGGALAGSSGDPALSFGEDGALASGYRLQVAGARPGADAVLMIGAERGDTPFKGGTLVPRRDKTLTGLVVAPDGSLDLTGAWPAAVSGGSTWYFQVWVRDAAGPQGAAASNAISVHVR